MADFDMVLKGDVVLPHRVLENGYVAISDGKIALVGQGDTPGGRDVEDYPGCWLFPGVIDSQVHSRSQKGQEGFRLSTQAAAAGGVTTICDMPFDEDLLICNVDRFEAKKRDVVEEALVDVAIFATIDPNSGVDAIPQLAEAGACAFKFSTFEAHPKRFPRTPTPMLLDAFRLVAKTGLIASVHNENQEVIAAMLERCAALGMSGPATHAWTRPPINEALAMLEIYELGVTAGVHAHVVHCSLPRGIEICESYKQQGHSVSVEVLLPYFFLTDEDVQKWGAFAKINPPIRTAAEREGLWQHFAAGHVDLISTDHVAWSRERKNNPDMLKNNSGFPSLELLLPLMVTGCMERSVDLSLLVRCLAYNPARHFRLVPRKGALEVGNDADIAIVERADYSYDPTKGHTCVDWSPFSGRRLKARVRETWLRGQRIYDGVKVVSEPRAGQFVRPIVSRSIHSNVGL